jgi:hypothetical protein
MPDPEIYYYLKRMDADLQDELKPKLKNYINLDRPIPVSVTSSSSQKIGIIHASQRNNADLRQKMDGLNFSLIIFLIQEAGKPKEATLKYREEFPNVPVFWDCGTEYLIEHFDTLETYLQETPGNWNLEGWIRPEFQYLLALAILCQGYLAINSESGEFASLSESCISQIKKNVRNKQEQVSEARWWLEVFRLWDEENQKINAEKWEEFEIDIIREWDSKTNEAIPGTLMKLLKAINVQQTELKKPQIVAEAYRAIAFFR